MQYLEKIFDLVTTHVKKSIKDEHEPFTEEMFTSVFVSSFQRPMKEIFPNLKIEIDITITTTTTTTATTTIEKTEKVITTDSKPESDPYTIKCFYRSKEYEQFQSDFSNEYKQLLQDINNNTEKVAELIKNLDISAFVPCTTRTMNADELAEFKTNFEKPFFHCMSLFVPFSHNNQQSPLLNKMLLMINLNCSLFSMDAVKQCFNIAFQQKSEFMKCDFICTACNLIYDHDINSISVEKKKKILEDIKECYTKAFSANKKQPEWTEQFLAKHITESFKRGCSATIRRNIYMLAVLNKKDEFVALVCQCIGIAFERTVSTAERSQFKILIEQSEKVRYQSEIEKGNVDPPYIFCYDWVSATIVSIQALWATQVWRKSLIKNAAELAISTSISNLSRWVVHGFLTSNETHRILTEGQFVVRFSLAYPGRVTVSRKEDGKVFDTSIKIEKLGTIVYYSIGNTYTRENLIFALNDLPYINFRANTTFAYYKDHNKDHNKDYNKKQFEWYNNLFLVFRKETLQPNKFNIQNDQLQDTMDNIMLNKCIASNLFGQDMTIGLILDEDEEEKEEEDKEGEEKEKVKDRIEAVYSKENIFDMTKFFNRLNSVLSEEQQQTLIGTGAILSMLYHGLLMTKLCQLAKGLVKTTPTTTNTYDIHGFIFNFLRSSPLLESRIGYGAFTWVFCIFQPCSNNILEARESHVYFKNFPRDDSSSSSSSSRFNLFWCFKYQKLPVYAGRSFYYNNNNNNNNKEECDIYSICFKIQNYIFSMMYDGSTCDKQSLIQFVQGEINNNNNIEFEQDNIGHITGPFLKGESISDPNTIFRVGQSAVVCVSLKAKFKNNNNNINFFVADTVIIGKRASDLIIVTCCLPRDPLSTIL